MQNSIEMIGFCFFILFFMASARHLLIFSSGIKVIDKLFEEKLAKMLFFYNFVFTFMIWKATPYLYHLKLRCKYEELDEETNVS